MVRVDGGLNRGGCALAEQIKAATACMVSRPVEPWLSSWLPIEIGGTSPTEVLQDVGANGAG
jgi:hypothetical protein